MSRPQTIEEALSDLPSYNNDAFSKVSTTGRPLLRTRLRPAKNNKAAAGTTVNGDREDTTMEDAADVGGIGRSTQARFEKYMSGSWTPIRRTAWSAQRSLERNVKEAVVVDEEVVQSIEFDSTPHNPFLEARSEAITRFKDITPRGSILDADFLENSEQGDAEPLEASFLEEEDNCTEGSTKPSTPRQKRTLHIRDGGDNDDDDDTSTLPAAFLAFAKENMDKSIFSSPSKRRKMPPADFALLWQKSGRGGVSNKMIIAQQAFFAGEDLEEQEEKKQVKKKKVKEEESVSSSSSKQTTTTPKKGKSASQKQMDRLLGGKKRR